MNFSTVVGQTVHTVNHARARAMSRHSSGAESTPRRYAEKDFVIASEMALVGRGLQGTHGYGLNDRAGHTVREAPDKRGCFLKMRWQKRLSRSLRGWLRSKILSKYGIALLAEARNGLFAVDPADFHVSRALLRHGQYALQEINALTVLLADRTDPHLIFVGAHIGTLLIPIARDTRARHTLAFEPSPANLRLLELNLKLNDVVNIDLRRVAVGEQSGTIRFTENRINTGNSRVARDRGELEVPLVTLDECVADHWECVDLLVMDVEGFEVYAMRGAARALARTRLFLVEFGPEHLQEQQCRATDFVELVAEHFRSMYLLGPPYGLDMRHHSMVMKSLRNDYKDAEAWPQYFRRSDFVAYLEALPAQRGLVLNLLFSKDAEPLRQLAPRGSKA